MLSQGLNDPVGDQKPSGHKKICQEHYTAQEFRVVMQPCKILCGKLEINFSVLPLPSPCCLKPNTVQQHPLCLDPCQHQNFSLSKNSCQHLKICLASSWEQRKKCLRYHLIPPGSHALLRENPTETASPLATQTSRVNCSAQEVMQNSPSRSSFFFSS